jgi:hypothetical protein
MRALLLPTLAALLAAPLHAAKPYRAYNTLSVVPDTTRPVEFRVISRAHGGPADYWCAAGDYARRALGADVTARIYVLRPPGESPVSYGRSAFTFTLAPPAELASGRRPGDNGRYGLSVGEPGYNLSVAHARSFCPDSLRKFGDLGR